MVPLVWPQIKQVPHFRVFIGFTLLLYIYTCITMYLLTFHRVLVGVMFAKEGLQWQEMII